MGYLLGLANEVLLDIAEFLDNASDLGALSATSQRFHHIANPVLYSLAAAKYPYLLSWACETGRVNTVKNLLLAGISPNQPAIISAESRHWREEEILQDGKIDLTDHMNVLSEIYDHSNKSSGDWPHGERPDLFDPTVHGNVGFPCGLWNYISQNHAYWFPLHCAAIAGSTEIVKLLVDSGAYIDPPSQFLCHCDPAVYGQRLEIGYYWTPLHTALCCRNEAAANTLLSLGASTKVESFRQESTALHWAARGDCLSTVRLLVEGEGEGKVYIDDVGSDEATPLMWALAGAESIKTMPYLIQHGAELDYSRVDSDIGRPIGILDQAIKRGWYDDASFLVDAGARIDDDPVPALDYCLTVLSELTNPESVELQYIEPALPRDESNHGRCRENKLSHRLGQLGERPPNNLSEAVHYAGMIEFIKKLIHNGANIHGIPNELYPPPLILASMAHSAPIVDLFLEFGEDVDMTFGSMVFPLIAATSRPHPDSKGSYQRLCNTIDSLLRHGADPNYAMESCPTALFGICCLPSTTTADYLGIVRLMVSNGADINRRVSTVKLQAYFRLNYLYDLGLGPFPEVHFTSPLLIAFRRGHYHICRYLLDQGAEVSNEKGDLQFMMRALACTVPEVYKPERMATGPVSMTYHGDEDPSHDINTDPTNCEGKFCWALGLLLELDHSGWLAKDPESLWLSTSVRHFPLTQMFLDSGASDASWVSRDGDTCLHHIGSLGFEKGAVTADCVRRLIAIGANVKAINSAGESVVSVLLSHVFRIDHPQLREADGRVDFGNGDVRRFADLLTALLDNGATASEADVRCFEYLVRPNATSDRDHDVWLNLRGELRDRFVVVDKRLITRESLSH
ncbi:ankyrin [Hypoxylon crocopeplum]|nr:ankyrin [Hypoxylon crocopeplum]